MKVRLWIIVSLFVYFHWRQWTYVLSLLIVYQGLKCTNNWFICCPHTTDLSHLSFNKLGNIMHIKYDTATVSTGTAKLHLRGMEYINFHKVVCSTLSKLFDTWNLSAVFRISGNPISWTPTDQNVMPNSSNMPLLSMMGKPGLSCNTRQSLCTRVVLFLEWKSKPFLIIPYN